jgi:cell wall-associated NlpC family hydrolase
MKRSALILVAFSVLACSGPTYQYGNTIRVRPLNKKEAGRLLTGAKNHLGEPYQFGGTSSEGWDCSGFASEMYLRYLSYSLPRNTESLYSRSVKIPNSRKKPGDLVFFKIEGKNPSHVGIYMGHDHFIHASTSSGIIISSLREDYYRESFAGFRRPLVARAY